MCNRRSTFSCLKAVHSYNARKGKKVTFPFVVGGLLNTFVTRSVLHRPRRPFLQREHLCQSQIPGEKTPAYYLDDDDNDCEDGAGASDDDRRSTATAATSTTTSGKDFGSKGDTDTGKSDEKVLRISACISPRVGKVHVVVVVSEIVIPPVCIDFLG